MKIEGNAEGEEVKVGGTLVCNKNLTCSGNISVGGTCSVDKVLTGHQITIGGKLQALLINGKYVKIGRRGEVIGTVNSEKIVISDRASTGDLYGKDIRIEERCRIKNIYGEDISIEDGTRVTGEILYTHEIFIDENVKLSKEPKKVSSLPPVKA